MKTDNSVTFLQLYSHICSFKRNYTDKMYRAWLILLCLLVSNIVKFNVIMNKQISNLEVKSV